MEVGFLRTRVARRILLLFILSALLPAAALSVVSYRQVRAELVEQSRDRLEDLGKSAGMAVYERLLFLQSQLALLRNAGQGTVAEGELAGLTAVSRFDAGGRRSLLGGPLRAVPTTPAERSHMDANAAVLRVREAGPDSLDVLLGVATVPGDPGAGVLWGRVDPTFLWSSARGYAGLSTTAGFCVFDPELRPLRCDLPDVEEARRRLRDARESQRGAMRLEWTDAHGNEYLGGAWEVFLQAAFLSPSWAVVIAEDRATVLASLASFRTPFLAFVVFGLSLVALLSNIQVRRTLEPLVELGGATRRIAKREFDARVHVKSGDEFEDLADSFNAMARNLGAQFSALEAIGEIDRSILAELDRERIVTTVLERIHGVLPSDHAAIVLQDGDDRGRLYRSVGGGPGAATLVDTDTLARLSTDADHVVVDMAGHDELAATLGADGAGLARALVVPLWLRGEPAGYIILGHVTPVEYSSDDLSRMRQIADQVSVALANADLIDELEHLTWGALTALARAIDAKSSWTAGHSERVTALAQRIGVAMELSENELETLRRGGLLHDIGKIGIPGHVLDKPGSLTREEVLLMHAHTRVGARILEPIPALADIVPIILHHHERYDGAGYPDGLAGEDIPLLARILAVADVYDALTSHRPYRAGLPPDMALDDIAASAGSRFDPVVTEVFLDIVHAEHLGSSPRPAREP